MSRKERSARSKSSLNIFIPGDENETAGILIKNGKKEDTAIKNVNYKSFQIEGDFFPGWDGSPPPPFFALLYICVASKQKSGPAMNNQKPVQ